ncbi:MAG: AAA family ATPase, partial [Desulfobacteraceae bacterium]|nr:AAA family ATPase [Desulfobacteraceae bacterium]
MRYIAQNIVDDLQRKMVFIGGPRQVGKTTLSKNIVNTHYPEGRYFNWDNDD